MDTKAFFNIGYGLYVLTAREGEKDNGCIVNTVMQVTADPLRVVVAVNKANYTNGMIARTGVFNISVLSESVTFDVFKRFGFQSGATVDKFADFKQTVRESNGVLSLDETFANAVFTCKLLDTVDFPTHTMFIGEPIDARVLCGSPTCTYSFYQSNVKPRPEQIKTDKTVWRCKICGYEYEGETLPPDFICPICKHPASDFEKVAPVTI